MDKREFALIHSKSLEAHREQVAARPSGDPVNKGAELGTAPDRLAILVERFSSALLAKLRAAEIKYGRKDDWLSPDWQSDCQRKLIIHVSKGDPLDVAAYAAFCWHHDWSTASAKHRRQQGFMEATLQELNSGQITLAQAREDIMRFFDFQVSRT